MAGRFEGLSDLEWKLLEAVALCCEATRPRCFAIWGYFSWNTKEAMPTAMLRKSRGMPPVPFRYVLNSLLYILITGCRWCDLPQGKIWASKSAKSRCAGSPRWGYWVRSSAHRWLKRWQEDGTFEHLQARILALADSQGLINWNYGAVDGSFLLRPIRWGDLSAGGALFPLERAEVKKLDMEEKEKAF